MAKIIGIDLGTTNSAVSHMVNKKSEIIANAEGNRTTPSIVYIKGDELLVGELAKRKAVLEPENVVYEVKRFIGMQYKDVEKELKRMPYKTKAGKDGWVIIIVDGKEYKPEQISAFILKKLKEDAEKYIGSSINSAVITVPAYFNDNQRNATKAAGEIAGLKVERIINEPTAASLNYGEGMTKDEKVAVFDLGGGTMDVTIMEIGAEGTYQVLSTSGDTHLWGAVWDERIIDYILEEFKKAEDIDLSDNAMAMQRIKDEAEAAKKQLSNTEKVDITIPFITQGEDGKPRNLNVTLTRAKFESLTKDLFDKTKKPVQEALKDSKLSKSDINDIVLVGWSTRMPQIIDIVKDIFGKEPKSSVNPDEAVSLWAAIQWGIIQGDVEDILLMDVTPLTLATEVEGGLAHAMIERNTTIPAKKTNTFTNAVDNQPSATVHITQGERQFAKDNKSLGMFNIDLPAKRRGEAQIEVTFDIDANGILNVSAKELSSGKEQKVTIQWATGISDEEVEQAKADAEKFGEEDKKKKEKVEANNKLEAMIYQINHTIEEQKEQISEDEQESFKTLIEEANSVKDNEDSSLEDINAMIEKIEKELQEMASKYQSPDTWSQDSEDDDSSLEGEVIEADDENDDNKKENDEE